MNCFGATRIGYACWGRLKESGERRGGFVKGVAALMVMKHAGLTQREASVRLGLRTGAAVSYQVRRLSKEMERDERIRCKIERLSKKLDGLRGADEGGRLIHSLQG